MDAHAYLLDNPPVYALYADFLEMRYETKIRNRTKQPEPMTLGSKEELLALQRVFNAGG